MLDSEAQQRATEALELDAKTTEGPWIWGRYDDVHELTSGALNVIKVSESEWPPSKADAELIACYRSLCPELARDVQRLEEENAAVESAKVELIKEALEWERASPAPYEWEHMRGLSHGFARAFAILGISVEQIREVSAQVTSDD